MYHPGFKVLYDKGLMYYSKDKKKYRLLKTGKKNHFISETDALRIVRYLYYPTGQRKPGRSIHDPLAKMYGLQKQRLRYAKKGQRITETTLSGPLTHTPESILREKEIRREVKRYRKAPDIKETDLPRGTSIQMKFHVNRRQSRLYMGAFKIRLTKGDGSPADDHFVIRSPAEREKKITWITQHVIRTDLVTIALKLREKYGKTPQWQIGGTVGFVWVKKYQRHIEVDENGKNIDVIKLHRPNFKEEVALSFERELRDAVEENMWEDQNMFKSGNKIFRCIQITSFTVKLFTSTETLTPEQKTFAKTVGIYPSERPAASWKNR